jgi:hypothetical protein
MPRNGNVVFSGSGREVEIVAKRAFRRIIFFSCVAIVATMISLATT